MLLVVMIMKSSKDILSSVLKTTQMGQIGIRAVLNKAVRPAIKEELRSQLKEYDSIEQEAHTIAATRGWEIEELDPAVKAMAKMYARTNLTFGNVDSKIAAMMIQGNTRGMIKGLKNCHHSNCSDERILTLSQKLLDCESDNIKQMQGYV